MGEMGRDRERKIRGGGRGERERWRGGDEEREEEKGWERHG